MKHFLLLLLFVIGFIQSGFAQTANPSAPFVSPQAKALYLQLHNRLSVEWYEVAYYTTDPNGGSLTPAYVDLGTMTAYRWTGVVLQPDQIPMYFTHHPGGGSGLIFPSDPTQSKLQFEDIDPPTFYMLLPDGKYAEGYFDNGHDLYYRWGDLELDKSQLPADAVSKNRILPPGMVGISTIPPPTKDGKKLPGAATQTPSNDHTSSASDQAAPTASPQPALPQPPTLKPLAEVTPASDIGIPWWLYAVIVLSIAVIIGAGYYLSNRNSKGR
jgi:hypothetical protein